MVGFQGGFSTRCTVCASVAFGWQGALTAGGRVGEGNLPFGFVDIVLFGVPMPHPWGLFVSLSLLCLAFSLSRLSLSLSLAFSLSLHCHCRRCLIAMAADA